MLLKSHMKLTQGDTKQGNKVWHILYMVEQNHYFAYFRNQHCNIAWCMGSKNNLDDIILLAYDEHVKKITFWQVIVKDKLKN